MVRWSDSAARSQKGWSMIESRAQHSLWPLAVIAALGAALVSQACSGRVQDQSDCRTASNCGGFGGAAGGKAEAGSSAVAGSAAGSGTLAACANSSQDADESDVDCGGSSKCERCIEDARCTTDGDCESGFCKRNRCTRPTCFDKVQNRDETGVDCGGSNCDACPIGVSCSANSDCSEEYCADGACADHCLSGARDGDETAPDCGGGRCEACADGRSCQVGSDCQSSVCSKNRCQAATCNDRIKNQDESEIDCGGVCSASNPCPLDAHCTTPADCESYICSAAGKCLADIVIPPADVIDDFEDGNLSLPTNPALGGRVGNWYGYGDGTGTSSYSVSAIKRGASSVNGLRAIGTDFKGWGSGLSVDLNGATKLPYDASAYSGITFWARAEETMVVRLALPDVDTDAAGQTCTICDHHYYTTVQLTTNWQRFTVAFSELVLEMGSVPTPTAFKPNGIVSIQFLVVANQKYELYLDDLAFVKN
jgi:hypothetical protein